MTLFADIGPVIPRLDWRPWEPSGARAGPREDDPEAYLRALAPAAIRAAFGPHQRELIDWAWAIRPGERPRPFVALWPRGGAKSTLAELVATAALLRGTRRYVLYVSATQEGADNHVTTMGRILEDAGIAREVSRYGHSRGWRRNRLRLATGGKVDAAGLDTGIRGLRDEDARPDLIVLDDVDERHDSPAVTMRRREILTESVLPAGSPDAAVLFVQNLIHRESIASQLADRADFLADRIVSGPHPAIVDWAEGRDDQAENSAQLVDEGDRRRWVIRGTPLWAGQDIATCQAYVESFGLDAFRRECLHLVSRPEGLIYSSFRDAAAPAGDIVPDFPVPADWRRYLGLDFGGVNTAGLFYAEDPATKCLYLYRVYKAGGRSAREHAAALLAGEAVAPFCVGGSKSEGQWRTEFRRAGLTVAEPIVSDVEVGIDRVRGCHAKREIKIMRGAGDQLDDVGDSYLQQKRRYRRVVRPDGTIGDEIEDKSRFHYMDAERYVIARIRYP